MEVKFVDKIPGHINDFLEKEYKIYESTNKIESGFKRFYILAKEKQIMVGVLTGYTIFSEVCVSELLVCQSHRNKGVGRSLLAHLEAYFTDKNFTNINLVTNAFQAPDFYKKCGYTLEFVRENKMFPPFSKYFFVKWLSSWSQQPK